MTVTAGAWGLLAQEPEVPVFRAGVSAVRVDVTVEDRQDHALDGLAAADFELREDGILQRVETAQFVRRNGIRQTNLDEALPIRSREHAESEAARDDVRLFAIFLDDYHIEKDQQVTLRVRDALQQFVKGFGPNDLLTVMDPLTPLSALRYTRSFDDVLARIRTFEGRQGQLFPVRSVLEEAQLQSSNVWQIRATVTLSALEGLVSHLGGLGEGRKSVLFVSQGPPVSYTNPENHLHLQGIVQAANRGNVTIHAFDPRPLGTSQPGGAYALSYLAGETGGRAVANSNNPLPHLKLALADASAYYVLGYTPSRTASDGRFHRIEVRVTRPGVRVTARKGYWAPSARETERTVLPPREPVQEAALARLVVRKEGRVADIWFGAARGSPGHTRLAVTWDAVGGGMGVEAPVRLNVEALDGGPKEAGRKPRELEPGRTMKSSTSEVFELPVGQRVAWRLTVRAADGRVLDQWDQPMAVPDLRAGRVQLATPRVYVARTVLEARAVEGGTAVAPSASRRFTRTDRVRVDVEGYAEAGIPLVVSADVLGAGGRSLVVLPVNVGPAGLPRVAVPVSSLAQGIYVLRIRAAAGVAGAEERVAFEVTP
ncbi:MAG: VWA domain-containing protein [Vicinamibacterales bacterium]